MNCLGEIESAVNRLIPGKGHTRDYNYLHRMWNDAKWDITKAKENYGVSGQSNSDKSCYSPFCSWGPAYRRRHRARWNHGTRRAQGDGDGGATAS